MKFWGHYIMNLLENMDHELWESKNVIYCYTNKINGKRYVGQTIQKLRKRHGQHVQSAKFKSDPYDNYSPIHCAIRKYGIENFKLEILHIADEYSIDMLERHYIYFLGTLTKNNKGYNVSSGGSNGNPFAGKTEEEINEWKRKISETLKGKFVGENNPNYGKNLSGENHPMFGKKHSEESRRKISESLKGKYAGENHHFYGKNLSGENNPMFGKKHSEESRRKMSENLKGKFIGENNPRCTQIVGIGNDNVLFYKYIAEAEKDGFSKSSIYRCCIGKQLSHKGYKWYYKEDYDNLKENDVNIIRQRLEKEIKSNISLKNIVAVSVKSEKVLFFKNSKQAIKEGFSSSCIHKCCRGELKTHKGYRWYYKEDYDKMIEETD